MANQIRGRWEFKWAAKAALAAIISLAGFQISAGDDGYNPDLAGKWIDKPNEFVGGAPGLSGAEKEAFVKEMRKITEFVRESPVLKSPKGFDVEAKLIISASSGDRQAGGKWQVRLISSGKNPEGQPVQKRALFSVVVNDQWMITNENTMGSQGYYDLQGRLMFLEPVKQGEVGGFPLYQNEMLVIAKNNKPLWVPVTVEQLLKKTLSDFKASLNSVYKDGPLPEGYLQKEDHPMSIAIKKLEAELNSLSPEQLKAPAYVVSGWDTRLESFVVDKSEPGARAVVMYNPDYFDKSLPKTAVQLIIFYWTNLVQYQFEAPGFQENPPVAREFEVLNTLDYKKLAALLK